MPTPTTLNADEIRAKSRMLSAADFTGTIRSHYPYWDARYRLFLIMAVEAVPAEYFDWKPRPELFTARQMIVHIAEAEHGWIHHTLDGGPEEEWVVPADEPGQGWKLAKVGEPDRAGMLELLEKWHRPTQRWLDKPVAELTRVVTQRTPGRPERQATVQWILDHVQEHEIHHRAQLNTYLRLMGVEPPSV